MDLSIIIVHYKTPQLLTECIESIYQSNSSLSFEVIVINNDNESTKLKGRICENRSSVIWHEMNENAGFSRANNKGIELAKGKLLLFLNPDTTLNSHFLDRLVSFYQKTATNINLGLLACRIVSSIDKHLLVGSKNGFPSLKNIAKANPFFIKFMQKPVSNKRYFAEKMHYQNHQVDIVSGACLLIEKEKLVQNNLFFDEDFFLYYEDTELSFRCKKKGFVNYFCAEVEVNHVNSASTHQFGNKASQIQISEYLFFYKSYSIISYLLFGIVCFTNFSMNLFLLKRAQKNEKYALVLKQYSIFKKYYPKILFTFSRNTSGSRKQLIYEVES